MINNFVHNTLPTRAVFGSGAIQKLGEEAQLLGLERLVVITSKRGASLGEKAEAVLGEKCVGLYPNAETDTTTERILDAYKYMEDVKCDGIVAIGGGSTIGLAKALACHSSPPQIIVPTTYSGSEGTPIFTVVDAGKKTTQRDMRALPKAVIYDVDLTLDMPLHLTVTSSFNAMAHSVVALFMPHLSPIVCDAAENSVRALVRGLLRVKESTQNLEGRRDLQYGAWSAAVSLGAVGVGLHHRLCHIIAGAFGLPHAETHCILLPHTLAFNQDADTSVRSRLVDAIGHNDPAIGLHKLAQGMGAPTSLRQLGMPEEGITKAAKIAQGMSIPNPRPIEEDALASLIRRAWSGEPPAP